MADDDAPKQECPAGAPLWMCTFSDLMSLLLCFFVLLLSFSTMDAQKYKQVAGSMKDAFGIQRDNRFTGSPSGEIMDSTAFLSTPLAVKIQQDINDEVALERKAGKVEVELTHDGLLIRMKDAVAFEAGKASLRDEAIAIINKIGKVVAGLDVKITVSGHTDNIPIKGGGAFSSNWSLSTARAVSVVEYWAEKFQIPTSRMSAVGFADGLPLRPNDTPEGRAANRRVEFKIQANQQANTIEELSKMLAPQK
ncbi:MAG: flagellar motor protein MotB [Desulfobulbaceae bacterium]|nr:flagellar motor protein MotB [Desulfobulbaceae bacterium]